MKTSKIKQGTPSVSPQARSFFPRKGGDRFYTAPLSIEQPFFSPGIKGSASIQTKSASKTGNLAPDLNAHAKETFGEDFSAVEVRQDDRSLPPSVQAAASPNTIRFAPGAYQPGTQNGQYAIAHELAHISQLRRGNSEKNSGATTSVAGLESDAHQAAQQMAQGQQHSGNAVASPKQTLYLTFAEQLSTSWNGTNKGTIFDMLRTHGKDPDPSVGTAIHTFFDANGPEIINDDLWLALALQQNGPEPLWPSALITERHNRSVTRNWAPEAGNIEGSLEIPDASSADQRLPPIRAYFFPGQTDRRALVIGGVHGNEPQGSEVVERLRTSLTTASAAGTPPFFTTILVPVLIPRNTVPGTGSVTRFQSGDRYIGSSEIEPNRNFPLPGDNYAAARQRGATRPDHAELVFQDSGGTTRPSTGSHSSQVMLPETRALIALIERFHPERVASMHAHSLSSGRGDAPGIFVDPRGGFDPATDMANTPQGQADDALASRMLSEAQRMDALRPASPTSRRSEPFVGNTSRTWPRSMTGASPYSPAAGQQTVHYTSTAHGEGNSFGMWAPAAGITTMTVEVPQWSLQSGQLDTLMNVHRDMLQQVFLGPPPSP